jgi:membrane associated rhomboid family serine protease
MGPLRFAIFYLLGGLAATVIQILVAPSSTIAILGASSAVAAVMGAFLVTYRRDRIHTIVLLGYATRVRFVPTVALVGLWFLSQFFRGIGALVEVRTGGAAYLTEITAFAFGALTARLFGSHAQHAEQGLTF